MPKQDDITISAHEQRLSAILRVLKSLTTLPAQTIFYASALLTIASFGGADLPGLLGSLAVTLGVESLGEILSRVADGAPISEDKIRQQVENAIAQSGIERLLTSDEFQRTLSRLVRQQNLIKYAIQEGEYRLATQLAEQYGQHAIMLSEMHGELSIVRNQLETLATRAQASEMTELLHQQSGRLEMILRQVPSLIGTRPIRLQIDAGIERRAYRLRIFMASPSDVADERGRLRQVIERLNQPGAFAEQNSLTLQLLAWEDAYSSMGRPEEPIIDQMPVENWDIFIGILWTRFGSPTSARDPETGLPYDSGTEEEFRLAYRNWKETGRPHIFFYNREGPPTRMQDIDPSQWMKVSAFLTEFRPAGAHPGLITSFNTPEDFERRVYDDLVKLLPRLVERSRPDRGPAPAPYPSEDVLVDYLDWVQRAYSRLELRGIQVQGKPPYMPLDQVYVALKAGPSNPIERTEGRRLLEIDAQERKLDSDWGVFPGEEQRYRRLWELTYQPYLPSLKERDRPSLFGERRAEILTLGEAFRRYRWLVILGDPGSGKTTLVKWLALHLAQTLRSGQARMKVPACQVDPNAA